MAIELLEWAGLILLVITFYFMGKTPFLRKSRYVTTVRKIPITIHYSWIQFITFISITIFLASLIVEYDTRQGWMPLVTAFGKSAEFVGIIVLAYFIVVLHELGHSFTAQYFGYKVFSITVFPFAGLAQIEGDWYKNYKHEFWITINGPMVNLIFALLVLPFVHTGNGFVSVFLTINVILLALNLLPVYPLDGGRIFRSLCTSVSDWWTATKIAYGVGMVASVIACAGSFYLGYYAPGVMLLLAGFWGGRIEYSNLKKEKEQQSKDEERQDELFEKITENNPDMPLEERELMAEYYLMVDKLRDHAMTSFVKIILKKSPDISREEVCDKVEAQSKEFLEMIVETSQKDHIKSRASTLVWWNGYFEMEGEEDKQLLVDAWIKNLLRDKELEEGEPDALVALPGRHK